MTGKRIASEKTIRRLAWYHRILKKLDSEGVERISSSSFAALLGIVPSQIRQDLSAFGQFGKQGYGYAVKPLIDSIESVLGMRRSLTCILVGAGNVGRALTRNFCFDAYGMELLCAFDIRNSDEIEGFDTIEIRHPRELPSVLAEHNVDIAVLTVPSHAAVQAAEWLAFHGIRAIWNFTGVDIGTKLSDVVVENVHFADSLMVFSYQLSTRIDGGNPSSK